MNELWENFADFDDVVVVVLVAKGAVISVVLFLRIYNDFVHINRTVKTTVDVQAQLFVLCCALLVCLCSGILYSPYYIVFVSQ